MIRISQIKLNIRHDQKDLRNAIIKKLRISDTRLLDFHIVKRSIDARDKSDIRYIYTVDVSTSCDSRILDKNHRKDIAVAPDETYHLPVQGKTALSHRPVVIGSGPAGLFAAYYLAMYGYRPIIVERGSAVDERMQAVQHFWETGELDPRSNIQFGEGGAGTFSDGKLHTGVSDPSGRKKLVLQTFVDFGGPAEILIDNKPHLGTDHLVKIVSGMRDYIIRQGGEYYFNCCFREFCIENGHVCGIVTDSRGVIEADLVILAIGNSPRDTYRYIIGQSVLDVCAKPFAVGVRAEHLQRDINKAQYGEEMRDMLPPADSKMTYKTSAGRSVYSFCMCPGGYVVNSSSDPGYMCVNGMSYSGRDSDNANAAIVVSVMPSDDPMENIRFQMELEQKAYAEGNGCIVSQRFSDFENGKLTDSFGRICPVHKGLTVKGNIRNILPDDICRDIAEAIHYFSYKLEGFDDPNVILSAVESRTSAPVRILRNKDMQANIRGIYPAGEGAGYAGGITSAAIDGIKVFEQIYSLYCPF